MTAKKIVLLVLAFVLMLSCLGVGAVGAMAYVVADLSAGDSRQHQKDPTVVLPAQGWREDVAGEKALSKPEANIYYSIYDWGNGSSGHEGMTVIDRVSPGAEDFGILIEHDGTGTYDPTLLRNALCAIYPATVCSIVITLVMQMYTPGNGSLGSTISAGGCRFTVAQVTVPLSTTDQKFVQVDIYDTCNGG
jgi:hypothetical protein